MKVLYIVGLAHSGSTYTSRVLNQHSEIFTAGELFYLDEALSDDTTVCKCVSMAEINETCPFWNSIYEDFTNRGGVVKETGRLDQDNRMDWMKAVLSPFVDSVGNKFGEYNRLLFELIVEKSGSDIILDTSKRPWRLIPLLKRSDLDVHVLHLIKSPTNQIRSRVNRGYNFWHSAFMKYFRKNLLAEFLGKDERYFKLRFEDFVRDPDLALQKIFSWLDIESENLFEKPMQDFHHLRGGGGKSLYRELRPDQSKLEKIEPFEGIRTRVIKLLETIY